MSAADGTPCLGCPCCAGWVPALQLLRDQAVAHVAGELRSAPCFEDCLICTDIAWQADVAPVPPKNRRAVTEPCQQCSCCQLWTASLELARGHAGRHVAGEIRLGACRPGCIICAEGGFGVDVDEEQLAGG